MARLDGSQPVTIRVHEVDPYIRSVDTRIVASTADFVELERTCFFARSGGQVGDKGTIDGNPIAIAERTRNGTVRHFFGGGVSDLRMHEGAEVRVELDFDRRYRIMRLHTAQHLVELGLRATHCVGPAVGGAVSAESAYVDIPGDPLAYGRLELDAVQGWVDDVVDDNLRVERYWDGRSLWLIDGVGSLPCDGTHVRMTGEVGRTKISAELIDIGRLRVSLMTDDFGM